MATTTQEPVYFWKEGDHETGYLSQWYECPFKDDKDPKKTYKTAEHYMMHQKAILFGDSEVALEILRADMPRKVKSLGRKVKNFNEKVWDKHREQIVRQGNILKFTNAVTEEGFRMGTSSDAPLLQKSLKDMLLATGDRELVEASPFDRIWGIGLSPRDALGSSRSGWGLNLLGKALMAVRTQLREEVEQENAAGKQEH